MFSFQSNQNGNSKLDFNTKTGKFEISVDLTSGKHIRKTTYFYKRAIRKLVKYRKKYQLN